MNKILGEIEGLQRFFLIHSYLYYELNTTVVNDKIFDRNCRRLIQLQSEYPNVGRYWDKTNGLDHSLSAEAYGLSGKANYPKEIRDAAYHELYIEESNRYELYPYSFEKFKEMNGWI